MPSKKELVAGAAVLALDALAGLPVASGLIGFTILRETLEEAGGPRGSRPAGPNSREGTT